MLNKFRYILITLLLIAASQAAGQYIISTVCVGSVKYYRVDGETGATYTWKLTDPSGNTVTLPSTADTVAITWNMTPGIYKLSTIQHSILTHCDGILEIGDIELLESITPTFAGIGPLCLNSAAPALPDTSVNGITGSWSPSSINTSIIGTTTYTFTADTGQCAVPVTMSVEITNQITPAFESIGPLCLNSAAPALPDTSVNGITGTWSPSSINTGTTGTTIYTFTSDTGQCAGSAILAVEISNQIIPTFGSIGPLCLNSAAPALPDTSVNGITGIWSPSFINTGTIGTTIYTFTSDTGQCAGSAILAVEISNQITPVFGSFGPYCQNSPPPVLPSTSSNGITGTWVPAFINTTVTGVTTYTFTPDTGQCAVIVSIGIEITGNRVPEFQHLGPLCLNSPPSALPTTSSNGITGVWVLSDIATGTVGITNYTFFPDPGQCGVIVTMGIEVIDNTTPTFGAIGPLCLNSTPPSLPAVSINGVAGSWTPPTISTAGIGITTYTFTPDSGQCAVRVSIGIEVTSSIIPVFDSIGTLCLNSTAPELPDSSINNITGKWAPDSISTSIIGSTVYTFTPDSGQCATVITREIVVIGQVVPLFDSLGPMCMNSSAPALPDVSTNGIPGTWSPAVISTASAGTTTYTFTAGTGLCIKVVTMDIIVTPEIIPVFDSIGPLIQEDTPPALPDTSKNGIAGTWVPSVISTGSAGTATYTFTPQTGQCSIPVTMDITVYPPVGPAIWITVDKNPICAGTVVTFTATSVNHGINPVYVWLKNGLHVGHDINTYIDSTLEDNDVISCNLIASLKDAGTVTIKSPEIRMWVYSPKAGFTITENFDHVNGNILFNNTSTGADTYYWDFGNGQSSSETNPSITYSDDGIYMIILTAINHLSCTDTFAYKYEMLFRGLYIPNTFAPNATTTLGAVFQPAGIGLKSYKIEVYDNWGHRVWESTALDSRGTPVESWDGTYHGKAMPQGTYLWKVFAVFNDDSIWKGSDNGTGKGSTMGTVLLIR